MSASTDTALQETTPVAVELGFADDPPRSVELALPAGSTTELPGALETLRTFLLQDRRFLPARDIDRDAWFLFHRDHLLWLRVRPDHLSGTIEFPKKQCHDVTFDLVDGSRVQGKIAIDLPPDRSRPLDYINEASAFLYLYHDDFIWLVRRSAICRIWDDKSWESTAAPRAATESPIELES